MRECAGFFIMSVDTIPFSGSLVVRSEVWEGEVAQMTDVRKEEIRGESHLSRKLANISCLVLASQ
jgi:hypothetical protein